MVDRFQPWSWTTRGWLYLRNWALVSGQGFIGWLYIMGLTGFRGRRGLVGLAVVIALGLVLLPGIDWVEALPFWPGTEPEWMTLGRIGILFAVAPLLPLLTLGRRGAGARVLAWAMTLAVLFFSLYAGGDWMKAFRWLSLAAVPMSVLLADALVQLSDRLGESWDYRRPAPALLASADPSRVFWARTIDRLALLAAFAPGLVAAGTDAGLPLSVGLLVAVPLVVGGGQVIGLARRGQTLGMALQRIRAADDRGRPARPSRSLTHLVAFVGNRSGPPLRTLTEGTRFGPPWRTTAWLLPTVALTVMTLVLTTGFVIRPETSPYDVGRRVAYIRGVQERLDLDHVTLMDVDMGAHMWGSDWHIVDMAGLIDVPVAHRSYELPFVRHYVYDQQQPTFAHVHASWARRTHMRQHDGWKQYVRLPDYPTSRWSTHGGNHVRKSAFVVDGWDGPDDRRTTFQGNLALEGWQLVTPTPVAGHRLALDVGWARTGMPVRFRPVVFLSRGGEVVWSQELPPGYDWYVPARWDTDEVVLGRHGFDLPPAVAPGTYDLGFVLMGHRTEATVRIVTGLPDGATNRDPVFARGEVRWAGAVTVLPADRAEPVADDLLAQVVEDGDCAVSEARWRSARQTLGRDHPWTLAHATEAHGRLARCWTRVARDGPVDRALDPMERALRWDHRDPSVVAAALQLADAWEARATGADDAADFAWLDGAARMDPTRTWTRRRAEAARERMLYLDRPIPCDLLMDRVKEALAANPRTEKVRGTSKRSWTDGQVIDWLQDACLEGELDEAARYCLQARDARDALLGCYRGPE